MLFGRRHAQRLTILLHGRPQNVGILSNGGQDDLSADPVLRTEATLQGRLVFTSDSNRSILAELEAMRSLEEHTVWMSKHF